MTAVLHRLALAFVIRWRLMRLAALRRSLLEAEELFRCESMKDVIAEAVPMLVALESALPVLVTGLFHDAERQVWQLEGKK